MEKIHYYEGEIVEIPNHPTDWFYYHHEELYKKYGECYLSIRKLDNIIIGSYKTYREALRETLFYYDVGEFNIYHCDGVFNRKYVRIPEYKWISISE